MRIFCRDLRRLIHSPAAMLVMAGVAILPSLYAWFNIAANIDPYANTSAIQIAVANNDQDASTNDLTINAGDQIMENLKENDQLGWVFTSEEKAVDGVRSGKYYAAIVIPEDFSDSLLSVLSGTLETPELNYYINEKVNAIAPKITDTGASTIQTQINDTFSSIAAESVSEVLKESISDLSGTVNSTNSEIVSLLKKKADKNLNEYEALLTEFTEKTSQSHDLISDAKDASDSLGNAAVSGTSALENAQDALKMSRQAAGDFSSSLSKSISDGEQILNSANSSVSSGLTSLEGSAGKINQSLQQALDSAGNVTALNASLLEKMQEIAASTPPVVSEQLSAAIAKLQTQNQENQTLLNSLSTANTSIKNALDTTSQTRQDISSLTQQSIDGLHSFRTTLDENLLPTAQCNAGYIFLAHWRTDRNPERRSGNFRAA